MRQLRAEITGDDYGDFYDFDIWQRIMQSQMEEIADHAAESARLAPETDPLADAMEAATDEPMAEVTGTTREERFIDALVADLDMPEIPADPSSTGDVVVLVDVEPMSADVAFSEPIDPTTSTDVAVTATEPDESTTDEAMMASLPIEDDGSTTFTESDVVATETELVREVFTVEDAALLAGNVEAEIVAVPRTNPWGRIWWLADIAERQLRFFHAPSPETSIIVNVVEED